MKKISMVYNYMLLNVTVILLVGLMVGFFILDYSFKRLFNVQKDAAVQSMQLTINAIETQHKIMDNLALDISIDHDYSPRFLQQSKMNEFNLMLDFKKVANRTNGINEYMLLYRHEPELVFTPEGKMTFKAYINAFLDIKSGENELYKKITALREFCVIKADDQSDSSFFCYPLSFLRHDGSEYGGVLVFVVRNAFFHENYKAFMSNIFNDYSFFYNKQIIATNSPSSQAQLIDFNNIANDENLVQSDSKLFSLLSKYEKMSSFNSYVSDISYLYMLLLILVVVIVSIILSYINIKPIRKLIHRFSGNSKPNLKNEMVRIESIIQNEMDKYDITANQLKEQLILLILDGNYQQSISDGYMQLSFKHQFFNLFLVYSSDELNEEFIKMVEDLSDNDMILYCVKLHEHDCYAIIANIESPELDIEIVELLESLLDATQSHIFSGDVCNNIKFIPNEYPVVLTELKAYADKGMKTSYKELYAFSKSENVYAIISALQNGSEEKALEKLKFYITEMKTNSSSFLFEQFLCFEVLNAIMEFANNNGIVISDKNIVKSFSMHNIDMFFENVSQIIIEICGNGINGKPNLSSEIIKYLNENFCDSMLSLDKIASIYEITANYVSIIVKEHVGISYKDYITNLRIKEACRLLSVEHLSVSDVSARVGYVCTSNFIKKFKEIIGVTPLKYRDI